MTKPSPALLPLPQRMTTGPSMPSRSSTSTQPRPAFSISTRPEMPYSSIATAIEFAALLAGEDWAVHAASVVRLDVGGNALHTDRRCCCATCERICPLLDYGNRQCRAVEAAK